MEPQTEPGNTAGNGTVMSTTISSVAPLIHPECPRPVSLEKTNYSVWITMNSPGDHIAGDTFEINGTIQRKNQSEDFENIFLFIERFGPHTGRGPQVAFEGIVDHYSGDCQIKFWSIRVNLSENLPPGNYDVIAYTSQQTRSYSFNVTQPRSSRSQMPPTASYSNFTMSELVTAP